MRDDISKLLTVGLNHESRATYCRAAGWPRLVRTSIETGAGSTARPRAWRGGIGLDKVGNPAARPKGLPPF